LTLLRRKSPDTNEIRRMIVQESRRANVGHIGSCLCVVEILAAVYGHVLHGSSPHDAERDRFILSKGHAGLALYATLASCGLLPASELSTFCGDDTLLGVHPEASLPGIDFSTGSLGHGLSIAAGAALAARLRGSARRAFCLISDAECNEGSIWEAAMFASHHHLSNLHAILDWNGQQAFGLTADVLDDSRMRERWSSFGWRVSEVEDHSIEDLARVLNEPHDSPSPHIVLARTIFGRGVRFMEQGISLTQSNVPVHRINWHYLPMSEEEYRVAISELGPSA
jgi:transketolase